MDSCTDGKVELPAECAWHQQQFAIVKDLFNRHWKDAMMSGCWLMIDKIQTPGWDHGPITQGLEPEPICTGMMMHTICITDGPLATYKLHCRIFGGKTDKDFQSHHVNTVMTQKWVNYCVGVAQQLLQGARPLHHKGICLYGRHHGADWPQRVEIQYGWDGAIKSDGSKHEGLVNKLNFAA